MGLSSTVTHPSTQLHNTYVLSKVGILLHTKVLDRTLQLVHNTTNDHYNDEGDNLDDKKKVREE
jgi:hypothetical protein